MTEEIYNNKTDEMLAAIRRELSLIIENQATEPELEEQAKVITVPKEISADLIELVDKIDHSTTIDPEMTAIKNGLKEMQLDLDQTYKLFRSIGNKFENIDFSCLGKRIRDLSLLKIAEHNAHGDVPQAQDVHQLLDKSFRDKTLDQLTEKMSERFRSHPGEFGDIPEVSHFFQYCTQLQHGLKELHKQRHSAEDLGERVVNAAESKYERITEIQDILQKRQDKK